MAKLIKKQNIVIVIGTYTNNQGEEKKKYRTIGELVTMQGDKGDVYQFGEIFYPKANFSVYDIKPREGATAKKPAVPIIQQDNGTSIETEEEEINVDQIPF